MAETERRNLPIAEEPELTTEIPAIRPEEPVHFAQMNSILESLLGNDVFLKRLADKMIENSLIAHVLDCENSQMVLGADQGPALTGLIDGVKEDVTQLYSDMGHVVLSYEGGNFYAQYGEDAATKKVLGEIEKSKLIFALQNSGLGLTLNSTPEQIYAALAAKFPGIFVVYNNGTFAAGYSTINYAYQGSQYEPAISNKFTIRPWGGFAYAFLTPKVDLSPYKTITFTVSQTDYSEYPGFSGYCDVGIANDVGTSFIKSSRTSNGNRTYTLDISGYNGKYYIGIVGKASSWYTNATVTKIELSV